MIRFINTIQSNNDHGSMTSPSASAIDMRVEDRWKTTLHQRHVGKDSEEIIQISKST